MSREPAHGAPGGRLRRRPGELVAKALGVEPCFVTPSWTEITAGKWSDRWDIAFGSGAITADRMTRLWMTTPYRAEETPARAAADRRELEHRRCRNEAGGSGAAFRVRDRAPREAELAGLLVGYGR